MKKVFSILFASLILFSGMHLTFASHFCCGELAAVKISLSGEKAGCGMEETGFPGNGKESIKTNCCRNMLVSCTSDGNYFPSFAGLKAVSSEKTPVFSILPDFLISANIVQVTYCSMVGPPVSRSHSSVDQSLICVFII